MNSRRRDSLENDETRAIISRRKLLAVSGVVAIGGLGGCLSRVASTVTSTGASPAAAFAGVRNEQFASGEPHVSRLTPTLSVGSRGVSGEVELEGWVTSSAVVAANYNNTRSNRSTIASPDSAVTDDELKAILAYLDGEPIVAERFTVCLPDAEVPGGNGSIKDAVTPQRFIDYMTGRSDGAGRVYSWGDADSDGDGLGDCDDSEGAGEPGAVCGASEHLVADVTGPISTGGSLEVLRARDGSVLVVNSPPGVDAGSATTCASMAVESDNDPCGPGVWGRTSGEDDSSTDIFADTFMIAQVMVQPPECPHPFPGLLFVTRGRSEDQLVYTGGWVIDDATLYEDSVTVLSMDGAPRVVGVDLGDLDADGDGLGDALERSLSGGSERAWRGARLDVGPVETLVEARVVSTAVAEGIEPIVRKRPGGRRASDGGIVLTHLALDAPVLHLTTAGGVSNEVKFKAGAELSKGVN